MTEPTTSGFEIAEGVEIVVEVLVAGLQDAKDRGTIGCCGVLETEEYVVDSEDDVDDIGLCGEGVLNGSETSTKTAATTIA